jgi:hypothetical protein
MPFSGVWQSDLGYSVVQGLRPAKPENASAIGFSDSLWGFVQRCWDGDVKMRPKVAEVVTHLEKAAANWNGFMTYSVQAENATPDPSEPVANSTQYCEPEVLILLRYHPLSNGTGGIFHSSVVPESPTESQTTPGLGLLSLPSTPSTQCTEMSQRESQEVVIKPSQELRSEPRVHMQPRLEEPHDDLHAAEIYPHLNQRYDNPPSQLPQRRRKDFRYAKLKLREFVGLGRSKPYFHEDRMVANVLHMGGSSASSFFPTLTRNSRIWNNPGTTPRNSKRVSW